jgi:hypothetical protein
MFQSIAETFNSIKQKMKQNETKKFFFQLHHFPFILIREI